MRRKLGWCGMLWMGWLGGNLLSCAAQAHPSTGWQTEKRRVFEGVEAPQGLTTSEERANWLATHFWDRFDFRDTTGIRGSLFLEQALTDYLGTLTWASPERQAEGLRGLIEKADQAGSKEMCLYLEEKLEELLAFSYSPRQDNEQFIAVLEAILRAKSWSEEDKERPSMLLELSLKNRKGSQAVDFTFEEADGKQGRMHRIESPLLLLLFYDPECLHCRQLIQQLEQDPLLRAGIARRAVKVLTIYPYADIASWRSHVDELPSEWIHSFDPEAAILSDELYELKITPALYLLDRQKNVLVREGTLQQVDDALRSALQDEKIHPRQGVE